MTAVNFDQANSSFQHPPDMHESQVVTVPAYQGAVVGGSCDGEWLVVVAWKPSEQELNELRDGACVYLSVLGELPPHCVTTSFQDATRLA